MIQALLAPETKFSNNWIKKLSLCFNQNNFSKDARANQRRWCLWNAMMHTIYPKKYAHGFVVLCFVVVMQSFIMNSHEVFIHIHQGCFAGTGAIVRLPQCQWSKPDGYGKISQCITTTKHSKAKSVCIFLGIYCITFLATCYCGLILPTITIIPLDFITTNRALRDCASATDRHLQGKTSHRQISWILEALRLNVIMIVSLWQLTGNSVALLLWCLANCRSIGRV